MKNFIVKSNKEHKSDTHCKLKLYLTIHKMVTITRSSIYDQQFLDLKQLQVKNMTL